MSLKHSLQKMAKVGEVLGLYFFFFSNLVYEALYTEEKSTGDME